MRRLLAATLAVFFFAAILGFAQDSVPTTATPKTPRCSGSLGTDLKSRYFGSTVDAVFADQLVLQSWLDVGCAAGPKTTITVGIWDSIGQRPFKTNATETDLSFGIAREFGKGITVQGTGSIFFLNKNAGFDVLVGDLKVSKTFASSSNTVTPYAEVQGYHLTNRVAVHGSVYPMLGVAYTHKFSGRLSLSTVAHENYDSRGGFGFRKSTHTFYAEAGLRIAVSDSVTVTIPRVAYGGAWNDSGRPKKATYSMGIAKTF